ncbi:molybdenum cofactor biosynthesis protein [Natrinema zhouii]|uniref:Molybdenum cofactor biosynthesis protein n=1 Tax=Natrinema zhouii TaxID=1710539 RepID=A0A7D6CP56_9EURY|nr:molybdenum cofactor synthesis domain-containing protein [Natrinema zhouii]QLK24870.1 molybdenum cofactor biosynthesis protein [Natrinema zhouii]
MNETDSDATEPGDGTLCIGVVTIASDRSLEADAAGEAINESLEDDGNEVVVREHVGSDYDRVQSIVSRLIDRDDVEVVLTAGATGVEPDDITIEAVDPLLEKELTAFSELFTALAYEQAGTKAVIARTLAGIAEGTPVFCLPGDPDAVRLALEEIILPEAAGIVELAREPEPDSEDEDDPDAADEPAETGAPSEATNGGA